MISLEDYKGLEQHKVLAWYDGPILLTLIDPYTKNFYIEYFPDPEGYLAKTSIENVIKILRNEKPINYAFENGDKFWAWNPETKYYEDVGKFGPEDLFDANVYTTDVLFISKERTEQYIEQLIELNKSIDYFHSIPKCIQYKDKVDEKDYYNPFYLEHAGPDLNIIGSTYYIIGGLWSLKITGYDTTTGILTGVSVKYPDSKPEEFKMIPLDEGIKHMYVSKTLSYDDFCCRKLMKLRST